MALCSSPGEKTESQGKPQAFPHCWDCVLWKRKSVVFFIIDFIVITMNCYKSIKYNSFSCKYLAHWFCLKLIYFVGLISHCDKPVCTKSSYKGDSISLKQVNCQSSSTIWFGKIFLVKHAMEICLIRQPGSSLETHVLKSAQTITFIAKYHFAHTIWFLFVMQLVLTASFYLLLIQKRREKVGDFALKSKMPE